MHENHTSNGLHSVRISRNGIHVGAFPILGYYFLGPANRKGGTIVGGQIQGAGTLAEHLPP